MRVKKKILGGGPRRTPANCAKWSPALRDEVNAIDNASADDLPTVACLAVGAAVVIHKSPQFVLLGVCNNSDGVIDSIELDQREEYHVHSNPGHSVVYLRYTPVRLDGLPRGVVAFAPVEKPFSVVGVGKRKFTIQRRQLLPTAGSVYVALSRVACLEDLYLLFPATLEDPNKPRNKDVVALTDYLQRLEKATLADFLQDPTRFTPASASLAHLPDVGPRPMAKQQQVKGANRHGHGATRRTAY
ncbi:unnamed protein product [Ectocarpus sp. CCAP 1310/34]|nr:unnamed protein product [Ectocarpus sp. CCAP 1310/34]